MGKCPHKLHSEGLCCHVGTYDNILLCKILPDFIYAQIDSFIYALCGYYYRNSCINKLMYFCNYIIMLIRNSADSEAFDNNTAISIFNKSNISGLIPGNILRIRMSGQRRVSIANSPDTGRLNCCR